MLLMRAATIQQTTAQAHEMTEQEHRIITITTVRELLICKHQLEYKRSKD
jgi:hypothetical protein